MCILIKTGFKGDDLLLSIPENNRIKEGVVIEILGIDIIPNVKVPVSRRKGLSLIVKTDGSEDISVLKALFR